MRAWWPLKHYAESNNTLLIEHFGKPVWPDHAEVIFMHLPIRPPTTNGIKLVVYPTTSVPDLGCPTVHLEAHEGDLEGITPTVELTWQLILRLTRPIDAELVCTGGGMWNRYELRKPERMLSRMTLGVIGMGRLGSQVAKVAEAFGVRVISNIPDADVITLHKAPLPHPVLDWPEFRLMKRGVVIVNTAQGNAINLKALQDGLESGLVAGAALDVLPNEFDGDPLVPPFEHPNLLLTPHIGGSTQDAWEITQRRAIDKALKHLGMAE